VTATAITCATRVLVDAPVAEHQVKAYHLTITAAGPGTSHLTLTLDGVNGRPGSTPVAELNAAGVGADAIAVSTTELTLNARPSGPDQRVLTGTLQVADDTSDVVCWPRDLTPVYRYDAATGVCRAPAGSPGMNRYPVPMVRHRKDGECVAFGNADMLNEDDYSFPELRGWNLAGADLSLARLSFAKLLDADFRGATLTGMQFGYVWISGTVDGNTDVPADACTVASGSISCVQ
jgi:hypothetical protein